MNGWEMYINLEVWGLGFLSPGVAAALLRNLPLHHFQRKFEFPYSLQWLETNRFSSGDSLLEFIQGGFPSLS